MRNNPASGVTAAITDTIPVTSKEQYHEHDTTLD